MGIQIYRRFFKKKKIFICGLILVIGMGVFLNGVSPYIFGKIIDAITTLSQDEFKRLLVLYFAILFVTQALNIIETMFGAYVVNIFQNEMQRVIMEFMLVLKCHASDKVPEGEMLNRLEFDADTIVSYYIDLISSILMIVVNVLISLYFIFHISAGLSWIVTAIIPILYIINFVSRKQFQLYQKEYKRFLDQYYERINWILRNLDFIKIFELQRKINIDYKMILEKKIKLEMRGVRLSNKVEGIRGILIITLNIAILSCAGFSIIDGQMSIGNMVAFNSYLSTLLEACNKILELNLDKQKVSVCYGRMLELENWEKEEIKQEKSGNILEVGEIQEIELRNVFFSYGDKKVLEGLNLYIDGPGLYTISGENGCGKTTILKLLERLYECMEGEIMINQNSIEQYDIHDLRLKLAYMAKNPFFSRDTILNNLRIGTKGVSENEAIQVCKKVGIHDDIMKLEEKYQTVMEPQGQNFSSGQKQKLGFARLLLRRAQVYLLDEVTSDLDDGSRKKIGNIILELAKEHIVINVTHYTDYIEKSKKNFVIDKK